MSLRLTEEELAKIKKRAEQWGKVRTHTIAKPGEGIAKDRRPRTKYNNVKTEADGLKFDSKREAKRWMDLRLQEKSGEIQKLERQVAYPIEVNGVHICKYVADFVYERNGKVVEDCKGYRTDIFKLKAKLMKAVHGIEVKLT